jgi:phage gp46-like protein
MSATTRFYIDPSTRDWVQYLGQPKQDDSAMSEAFYLLDLRRGTATAFPTWGSRLHTLTKMIPTILDDAKAMCEEALAPMVQDQRIRDLTVTVTKPTATYLQIVVKFYRTGTTQETIIKKLLTLR